MSYRLIFVIVTVCMVTVASFADTLRLKDGSIIKGKIVGFQDGKFTVAIGDGARKREMTFFATEILSIVFDAPPSTVSNRTAVYTPPVNEPKPVIKTPASEPISNPVTTNSGGPMKPIGWNVKVLADNTANGWTNTGWVVKKGQRIRISGDGQVSLGSGRTATPSGNSEIVDNMRLLKNVPTGALIAVIGDDNDEFIYVGMEREVTATRDGALFLGINEGNLDDNKGSFDVKVEVIPGT